MPYPGLGRGGLGRMPLGHGGPYLATLIAQPATDIFRRLQIKRRNVSDGKFEANWQDVSTWVKMWGTLEFSLDDVKLNNFQNTGLNVVMNNDKGKFTHQGNLNSYWYGYMTRFGTLVRVQAGLLDSSSAEYPTDPTMGVFVLNDEVPIRSDSNDVLLKCSSLRSVFDNILATDIVGLGATLTASQIVTRIRDHTDGSGNFLVREFITSTAWTVTATTNNYLLNTTTNLDGLSAWELMENLAQAEGMVVLINRTGGIEFTNKTPRQASSQFSFFGQDFPRPNVMAITDYREDLNNYYDYFRLQYLDADTSTSFVTAGTTTVLSPTNLRWQLGQRIYEFKNTLVQDTSTAQTIVNNLLSNFGNTLTSLGQFNTLFCPQLELLDRVDVSFHSYDLALNTLWDVFDWDGANWSAEGENFDWNTKNFYIIKRQLDIDNLKNTFTMREVV